MKKWEYGNIKRVDGIHYLNDAVYYNNRQYRNQNRNKLLKSRKQKKFLIKPNQTNKIQKTYISEDVNLIYFMEYCKVRNTITYNQLNPSTKNNDLKYFRHTTPNSLKTDKMLNAYNKSKNEIIDFKKRRSKLKENVNKMENKQDKKVTVTKKDGAKQFKDSIKLPQKKLSELDKAVIEFERALKERKEYEKELKEKGSREVKVRRNPGTER